MLLPGLFFLQAEDGIRDLVRSRGLGDVYKRQVVDDAHGFGVLGPGGRGSIAHFALPPSPRLILMGTLGKAAGVSGAFVAGDRRVIDWLIQRARPYIFTTASSPLLAAALLLSLIHISEPTRPY